MACRNTDNNSGHTCAGSKPSGASMVYDNEGRMASWTAPSNTEGSAHYLYDTEGNRVLSIEANLTNTPNTTIYFGDYTETVISASGTTTTTKYYSANPPPIPVPVRVPPLPY